jgi:hypothetical protein
MLRALFLILLLHTSAGFAQTVNSPHFAYKCLNSAGKVGIGSGRLSLENEYSAFLRRSVRAGEFVVFQYAGRGKEYWFIATNCVRV